MDAYSRVMALRAVTGGVCVQFVAVWHSQLATRPAAEPANCGLQKSDGMSHGCAGIRRDGRAKSQNAKSPPHPLAGWPHRGHSAARDGLGAVIMGVSRVDLSMSEQSLTASMGHHRPIDGLQRLFDGRATLIDGRGRARNHWERRVIGAFFPDPHPAGLVRCGVSPHATFQNF